MISILLLIIIISIGIFIGAAPMRRVARASAASTTDTESSPQLRASVIVLALHSDLNIEEYLENLYKQDYPDYEVIVVCDTNAETAAMLSEKFASYPGLHITFLPPGSRRLSRRKLALTIGIKGAQGDVVLTTSTLVKPFSTGWISAMMAPFNEEARRAGLADIAASMGVIIPDTRQFPRSARSAVSYESNTATIQWAGAALGGKPYRCAGYNMAFRRQLFFTLKGYSSSILLMDGEDDIFLRRLAEYGACIPVLSPDAAIITDYGEDSMRIYREYKSQYLFTRKFLPKAPFLRRSLLSWCRWLAIPAALLPIAGGIYTLIELYAPVAPGIDPAAEPGCRDWWISILKSSWATAPGEWASAPWVSISCMAVAILLLTGFGVSLSKLYISASRRINPLKSKYSILYCILRSLWQPIANLMFRLKGQSHAAHYTYSNA